MKPDIDDGQEVVSLNSSEFLSKLKKKWDEIHLQPDVFRYKIKNIREKVVDNKYIILLNTDRGSNRRTPECIVDVRQPFDNKKFNFNKVSPREIIFKALEQDSSGTDVTTFLVNVSPISRYHTLLCPSINKCLPQIATEASLKLVLKIKFVVKDCDLKIIFNSLCAFASVNHLHYHLLFEKNPLNIEIVECIHLKGPVYIIEDNPLPAFCFQVTEATLLQSSKDISKLIEHLLSKSIAHNIIVTCGEAIGPRTGPCEVVRVAVVPRKNTADVKRSTTFKVGACEVSGWFLVFDEEQFNRLTAKDLEDELHRWKLPNFAELCDEIKSIY